MMSLDTAAPVSGATRGRKRTRWMRVVGWALVVLGVIVSWGWSVELTLAGESGTASVAGALTFVFLGAGIALIWLASAQHGRRSRVAFTIAMMASIIGALVAGITPVAVTATTVGTVSTVVSSDANPSGYNLSTVGVLTSDTYGLTRLDVTVHAADRTTPRLEATVAFGDGTVDLSCSNTRQTWTHDVSTVTLVCDAFAPISALKTISSVSVSGE